MTAAKTLTTVTCVAIFVATQALSAEVDTNSVQTIWNVGQTYDTIVKMTIDISNATLTAASEYKGSYSLPHLVFRPVLRLRTNDIRKNGVNYYGKRTYVEPKQLVEGIEAVKWKYKYGWAAPWQWVAIWRMSHDNEIQQWKSQNKELADQIKEKGIAVEAFSVFYTDDHKEVDFNPFSDSLLLNWSESSVRNFHRGEQGDLIVKVYHGKMTNDSGEIVKASGNIPRAEYEIQRKIVAECNVLASVLYDDPSGNRRALLGKQKEWKIDAGALNRGLLFYGGMNSLIHFDGTLKVRKEPIRPSDCKGIGLTPFCGDKVFVLNSSGAKAGYHIGDRWKAFPLNIDYAKREDPNANMIEFWFDHDNNVLRYAHIRVVRDNYDGDIPNPRLGKMTSALKGSVKGRVSFEIEYWTAVNQPLPEM